MTTQPSRVTHGMTSLDHRALKLILELPLACLITQRESPGPSPGQGNGRHPATRPQLAGLDQCLPTSDAINVHRLQHYPRRARESTNAGRSRRRQTGRDRLTPFDILRGRGHAPPLVRAAISPSSEGGAGVRPLHLVTPNRYLTISFSVRRWLLVSNRTR